MKKSVIVRTTFQGYHRYKNAPKAVEFLRHWHRHLFYVEVWFNVEGDNREIEFFMAKDMIDGYLEFFADTQFELSCEQIAIKILDHFKVDNCYKVKVFEDNENGAEVEI
jgi:hypothetical protein